MTRVFGEVASTYDDVRAGYPDDVLDAIRHYRGGPPASVADLGAGTGKATGLLLRLGAPVIAIEPDPRMADVLRAKFPDVDVAGTTFEEWAPPPGGVDLLACATAWHWLDPATRNQRAAAALSAGGTLAILYHRYGYADPDVSAALDAFFQGIDPDVPARPAGWAYDEVAAAGVWSDVQERDWHEYPELTKQRYLTLAQTFSPFRRHSPELRQRTLDGLDELLGETVVLDLRTVLVLARRD